MSNSLPYVVLLGALALGIGGFLYIVLDPVVVAIIETSAWQDGSTETMAGRERLLAMWDSALILTTTGVGFSVLWASRRGA